MSIFQKHSEERAERQASAGSGRDYFKPTPDGETVRLLEKYDDLAVVYAHQMEPDENNRFTWWEVCLDQDEEGERIGADCPGCEGNMADYTKFKRKPRGYLNLIWRDAPVTKYNKETKKREPTGEKKDTVVAWTFGPMVGEELWKLNEQVKDITNRDMIVKRKGSGFDTSFTVQPVTDDQGNSVASPMSDTDKVMAEDKYNFDADVAKKKIEDWGVSKKRKPEAAEGADSAEPTSNPFVNRNRNR